MHSLLLNCINTSCKFQMWTYQCARKAQYLKIALNFHSALSCGFIKHSFIEYTGFKVRCQWPTDLGTEQYQLPAQKAVSLARFHHAVSSPCFAPDPKFGWLYYNIISEISKPADFVLKVTLQTKDINLVKCLRTGVPSPRSFVLPPHCQCTYNTWTIHPPLVDSWLTNQQGSIRKDPRY